MAEARITLPEKAPFRQTAFYTGPQGDAARTPPSSSRARPHRVPHHAAAAAAERAHRRGRLAEGRGRAADAAQQRAVLAQGQSRAGRRAVGFTRCSRFYPSPGAVGRDPPNGTIIPLFDPPDGMSPAAVRYVDRMSFDDRCFAAAIVDLGVKGHLRIVEAAARPPSRSAAADRPLAPEESVDVAAVRGEQSLLLASPITSRSGGPSRAWSIALKADYLGMLFPNNFLWSGDRSYAGAGDHSLLCFASPAASVISSSIRRSGSRCSACRCDAGAAMVFIGWRRDSAREVAAYLRPVLGGARGGGRAFFDLGDAPGWPFWCCRLGLGWARSPSSASRCCSRRPGKAARSWIDRGLSPISQRCRGRPARSAQSAGEDAGAVREVPALRGRARLRERLGQISPACSRRPARRCGDVLVCRRPRLDQRSARSPTVSAAGLPDHLVGLDRARLERRQRRRQQRRRLLRRRRRRRRRRRLVRREFLSPRPLDFN